MSRKIKVIDFTLYCQLWLFMSSAELKETGDNSLTMIAFFLILWLTMKGCNTWEKFFKPVLNVLFGFCSYMNRACLERMFYVK